MRASVTGGEHRAVEKLSRQRSQGLRLGDRRSRDQAQGRDDGSVRLQKLI
jgi:hypothetical protein